MKIDLSIVYKLINFKIDFVKRNKVYFYLRNLRQ